MKSPVCVCVCGCLGVTICSRGLVLSCGAQLLGGVYFQRGGDAFDHASFVGHQPRCSCSFCHATHSKKPNISWAELLTPPVLRKSARFVKCEREKSCRGQKEVLKECRSEKLFASLLLVHFILNRLKSALGFQSTADHIKEMISISFLFKGKGQILKP